jgi:nitrate reductase gamma subunit
MLALTYVAVTIFLAGNLYAVVRVMRTPAHLRWELYPIPRGSAEQRRRGSSYFEESEWWTKAHTTNVFAEVRLVAEEVLLQKTVWKNNRVLWPWTWLMHLGLFGTLAAIGFATAGSIARIASVGEVARSIATGAMLAGLAGSLGLIVLRTFGSKWRPYTSRAAFANLFVLIAFFCTGAAALLRFDGFALVGFARTFLHPGPAPVLSWTAAFHVGIAALFLAYFPFTHMTHAYMKFFTFHRVRWDDKPTRQDKQMQARIVANLSRPMSWSAAHIGRSRWLEAVDSPAGSTHD